MLKFKQYLLLKEDPENIIVNDKYKHFTDPDAIGFSLMDGICVYGKQTHNTLMTAFFHVFTKGEEGVKELESHGINVEGRPNQNNLAIMQPLLKNPVFNREKLIGIAPKIIHGRLWTIDKAVSFWNPPDQVFKIKDQIIKFIEKFGSPQDFVYELNNKMINFDSFSKEEVIPTGALDHSKVHTMTPGPEKKELQKKLGMDVAKFGSKSPGYPDAQTRAMMSQSEVFSR